MVSEQSVRAHFANWERNNDDEFYSRVAPWATFTIAGVSIAFPRYSGSRSAFFEQVLSPLANLFAGHITKRITNVIVANENCAIVEFTMVGLGRLNLQVYAIDCCWICTYVGEQIGSVTIYWDSLTIDWIFRGQ